MTLQRRSRLLGHPPSRGAQSRTEGDCRCLRLVYRRERRRSPGSERATAGRSLADLPGKAADQASTPLAEEVVEPQKVDRFNLPTTASPGSCRGPEPVGLKTPSDPSAR